MSSKKLCLERILHRFEPACRAGVSWRASWAWNIMFDRSRRWGIVPAFMIRCCWGSREGASFSVVAGALSIPSPDIRGKTPIEVQPFRNEGKAVVPWRCKQATY